MTTLQEISNGMAQVVAAASPAVVRVEGRKWMGASGVVWGEGVVVTANHVVERDDKIMVGLPGGGTAGASLAGRDPSTDLAVLRVEASGLAALARSAPAGLGVGQLVLAVGRPGEKLQAALGVIPPEAVQRIRERARFEVARIDEIEQVVKHDVIAFLTNVGEHVGPESRFIHLGMTSSDVLDTCLSVQMKRSGELLLEGLQALQGVLARRAREFKRTVMVGRTHGVHAEPTTLGLKFALWYDEARRKVGTEKWEGTIRDQLKALEDIYTILNNRAAAARAETLEMIIILLIALEIVMGLLRR